MRSLFLLTLCGFFLSASVSAQDQAQKYAQSITEEKLKEVLTIIASDQMEGRETGTEGQRRAAIYLSNKFKEIGLKSPAQLEEKYQQKYLLYRDSLISQSMSIGGTSFNALSDFMLVTGTATSDNVRNNQVVFAGYGIDDEKYSDYKGRDVKGKVVVVLNGEPKADGSYLVSGTDRPSVWGFGLNRKIEAAGKKGAAAIIFTDLNMTEFPRFLVSNLSSSNFYYPRPTTSRSITTAFVMPRLLSNLFSETQLERIRDYARDQKAMADLKFGVRKDVDLTFNKKRFSVLASNVIGYIEGSDLKDEYVYVTAHYDHLGMHNGEIYYGADDDGSGTTGVVEMAAAFQKAKNEGNGPRRSIVFLAFSGEEKGLWGSEYYSDNPLFPLDKTSAGLNMDMIGRIDPNRTVGDSTNYIYVIGNDKLSSDLDPIAKNVNDKYTKMELDFKFNDPKDPQRIYFRSDHYNFARKGVPVIFYFDGIHADYHKPSDTVDKINFDLMQKRTQYVFYTAWEIANRDKMLVRDIPLPAQTR